MIHGMRNISRLCNEQGKP